MLHELRRRGTSTTSPAIIHYIDVPDTSGVFEMARGNIGAGYIAHVAGLILQLRTFSMEYPLYIEFRNFAMQTHVISYGH
jgi:hypothetical protein